MSEAQYNVYMAALHGPHKHHTLELSYAHCMYVA